MATYTSGVYETTDISAADHTHEFTAAGGGGGIGATGSNVWYVSWMRNVDLSKYMIAGFSGISVGYDGDYGVTFGNVGDAGVGTPFRTFGQFYGGSNQIKTVQIYSNAGAGTWLYSPSASHVTVEPGSTVDQPLNFLVRYNYGQADYAAGYFNFRGIDHMLIKEDVPLEICYEAGGTPALGATNFAGLCFKLE